MNNPIKRVHIKTWICNQVLDLVAFRYMNDRIALELQTLGDIETGEEPEPFYTCTVNLPNSQLPEGHVFLKGWSENEGLPEALAEAGVLELTGVTVPSGFAEAQEAKLLIEVPAED